MRITIIVLSLIAFTLSGQAQCSMSEGGNKFSMDCTRYWGSQVMAYLEKEAGPAQNDSKFIMKNTLGKVIVKLIIKNNSAKITILKIDGIEGISELIEKVKSIDIEP